MMLKFLVPLMLLAGAAQAQSLPFNYPPTSPAAVSLTVPGNDGDNIYNRNGALAASSQIQFVSGSTVSITAPGAANNLLFNGNGTISSTTFAQVVPGVGVSITSPGSSGNILFNGNNTISASNLIQIVPGAGVTVTAPLQINGVSNSATGGLRIQDAAGGLRSTYSPMGNASSYIRLANTGSVLGIGDNANNLIGAFGSTGTNVHYLAVNRGQATAFPNMLTNFDVSGTGLFTGTVTVNGVTPSTVGLDVVGQVSATAVSVADRAQWTQTGGLSTQLQIQKTGGAVFNIANASGGVLTRWDTSNSSIGFGWGTSTATPSATVQISGTFIPPICSAALTCGSTDEASTCWSKVYKTLAGCNGAGSWVRLASTTLVSATAL